MSTGAIIAIVVVVVVVVVAVAIGMMMARRRRLRQRFGPEYDRVVGESKSQLQADAELAGRERRVRKLDIKPLSPAQRDTYAAQWTAIQERFVDQPGDAVTSGERLVTAVMAERGYPPDEDDQVAANLSVEHAQTLEHYRSARDISTKAAAGDASTEDLRLAMLHYRELFDDLLGDGSNASDTAEADAQEARAQTVTPDSVTPDGTVAADEDPVVSESAVSEPASGHVAPEVPVTMGGAVPTDGTGAPAPDPADATDNPEVPVQRTRR